MLLSQLTGMYTMRFDSVNVSLLYLLVISDLYVFGDDALIS